MFGALTVIVLRFLAYLSVWLIMVGAGSGDILAGVAATGLATWCSLALLPWRRGAGRIRPLLMLCLMLRFVWGSVLAGLDIARLAFSPALTRNFLRLIII